MKMSQLCPTLEFNLGQTRQAIHETPPRHPNNEDEEADQRAGRSAEAPLFCGSSEGIEPRLARPALSCYAVVLQAGG